MPNSLSDILFHWVHFWVCSGYFGSADILELDFFTLVVSSRDIEALLINCKPFSVKKLREAEISSGLNRNRCWRNWLHRSSLDHGNRMKFKT